MHPTFWYLMAAAKLYHAKSLTVSFAQTPLIWPALLATAGLVTTLKLGLAKISLVHHISSFKEKVVPVPQLLCWSTRSACFALIATVCLATPLVAQFASLDTIWASICFAFLVQLIVTSVLHNTAVNAHLVSVSYQMGYALLSRKE